MFRGHILGILRLTLIPSCRDSRGAQEDRVGDFGKLKYHCKKNIIVKIDSLFICYNKLVCDPSSLVGRNVGSSGYREEWKLSATGNRCVSSFWERCDPLPMFWDWVWVAQASPKGGPSIDWRKGLCLQRKQENGGRGLVSWQRGQAEGCKGSPRSNVIADIGKPLASSGSLRPGYGTRSQTWKQE